MNVYTLPQPNTVEQSLIQALGGRGKSLAEWSVYPSGEDRLIVRTQGRAAVILGRTSPNGDCFRTLLLVRTLRERKVRNITVVIPYFAYARQDRETLPGEVAIGRDIVAMLAAAGATKIVTSEFHSPRIIKSAPIPVISVSSMKRLARVIHPSIVARNSVIVAPDKGARERALEFAKACGVKQIAWVEKHRSPMGAILNVELHGNVSGKHTVIVDDLVDTGGTIQAAAHVLKAHGAISVSLCAAHPLLAGQARMILRSLGLRRIVFGNLTTPPYRLGRQVDLIPDIVRAIRSR